MSAPGGTGVAPAASGARVHAVDAGPGRRLRVVEHPEAGTAPGAPALLLHGFTGAAEAMEGVAEGLGPERRRIAPDLLGHGSSDAPRAAGAYRIERCAADLEAVQDALGAPRVHVVGYSMGARLGLAYALRHPGRVASALLVGARAGIADPEARRERAASDAALAERIEREGVPAFVERWMALPLFASQRHRLSRASLRAARAQRLRSRPEGLAGSLRGMGAGAQPPLHAELGALRAPVALVVGAEDERFLAEARTIASRLPDARLHVLPEAGHAAHLEQPEAFAALARAFLREVEGEDVAAARDARPAALRAGREERRSP